MCCPTIEPAGDFDLNVEICLSSFVGALSFLRYNAIKKVCLVDNPVPSQCVLSHKLVKPQGCLESLCYLTSYKSESLVLYRAEVNCEQNSSANECKIGRRALASLVVQHPWAPDNGSGCFPCWQE